MFAMALNGPIRSAIRAIKDSTELGIRALFNNSILTTFVVFPVVLWSTIMLALVQEAGGISTGNLPSTDPLLMYLELNLAPLRECLGFRVIPIGLVAFLILALRGRLRDAMLSLWRPSRYLRRNDSFADYRRHLVLMLTLVAISSLLFGLAHFILGGGWGSGKIAEAALAGVALGWLYYQYGLPAAVLLHWAIDSFLTTYDLDPGLFPISTFINLYTILLALLSSIVMLVLLKRKISTPAPNMKF